MKLKYYFWEYYWSLGIVDRPIEELLNNDNFFDDFKIIEVPSSYFLADPFSAFDSQDRLYAEQFDFSKQYGTIVEVTLDSHNQITEIKSILDEGKHRSFPFNLTVEGQDILIPENGEQGSLEFIAMPSQEVIHSINKPLIDPVVHVLDGTYFMFCTHFDGSELEELWLYWSEGIAGPWHKLESPICTDLRGARMAGKIIEKDGKLFRLGQDSSNEYGDGIVIFEITELSKTNYVEHEFKYLKPPAAYPGMHTMNAFGSKTIFDLRGKKLSLIKPARRFKKKYLS